LFNVRATVEREFRKTPENPHKIFLENPDFCLTGRCKTPDFVADALSSNSSRLSFAAMIRDARQAVRPLSR
jgi:hypothetical protein